ncbi:MAG: glycosyltransferase family 39 protein [Chloroflexi bacterium]|nr:glycosyltransferase family 39 protein [Chloroflexota bacterium]
MKRFVDFLPVIFLMWVFFFLRVHDIDKNMPYFIDELNHINRARIIYSFSDLHVSTTPGKFLLYYYLGLFDLPLHLPGWIARTAVVVVSLIGAASTYALAKDLFSHRAGVMALAFLSAFPFMIFHERLVLSDPLTASLSVLVVWYSIPFARKADRNRATILGIMICVMLLGKILAGPLIAMPIAAIVLLSRYRLVFSQKLGSDDMLTDEEAQATRYPTLTLPSSLSFGHLPINGEGTDAHHLPRLRGRHRRGVFYRDRFDYQSIGHHYEKLLPQIKTAWEHYKPGLIRVAVINAVVWGIILVFYVGRGLISPETTNPIVDDYIFTPRDRVSQLEANWQHFREMFAYLWGPGLTILTVLALPMIFWKRPRAGLYLLGGIMLLWLPVFITAARPNSRYLTLVGHLWMVIVAGGINLLWLEARRLKSPALRDGIIVASILLMVWGLGFGVSFAQTLMDKPTALDLPEAELNGYYRNFTGFALRDAMTFVNEQPPISDHTDKIVVLALTRACDFLPYHIPEDYNLQFECLGRFTKSVDVARVLEEYGQVYAIWEQVDPPTRIADPRWIQGRMEWLATFERPHDGIEIEVYRVYPGQPPIGGVRPSPDQ